MRALLALIKRQIIDGAVYIAVAAGISMALTVAIASVVLSESLDNLSSYAVTLILTGPVLIGVGSFVLGLIQTHSDRASGVTAMLLTLPVGRSRTLLARLVTGTLVILIALAPLGIVGAMLWKFLGPPEWLFHGWLADSFIGLSLTALACYCLGLSAGQNDQTFTSALRSLPLVPALVLLIVVKGLGWPLLAILLPLLAVLLLRCRERPTCNFMRTVTTGLTVLVFFAIPLYLARHICDGLLVGNIHASVGVSPSGLLPTEIENDPNVKGHSSALAYVRSRHSYHRPVGRLFRFVNWKTRSLLDRFYLIEELGILEYFESREKGRQHIYSVPNRELPYSYDRIHVDEVGEQLICHRTVSDSRADEFSWEWAESAKLYAGPGGMSRSQDSNIGRFVFPIVYMGPPSGRFSRQPNIVVYDKKVQCFYSVDFEHQAVERGPQLQDSSISFVKLGISEESDLFRAGFGSPDDLYRLGVDIASPVDSAHIPVVHRSGRIDLLDLNALELRGPAGHLPEPRTLFGKSSAYPRDLLDYAVYTVTLEPDRFTRRPNPNYLKKEYLGLVAGSLSRQGLWTAVAVFDKDGNKIKSASSKAGFFDKSWGPVLTATKYILESLHPPVLTLTSFFTAYSFEARSSHRALFLMPNSFVAMAMDYEGNIVYMFLIVLLLMLPALLFAGLLSWLVTRDAVRLGLSRNTIRLWVPAILAFGLPVYVTYRLTRPKIALVTCCNCGKPRRPDMDKCHRCGGKWDVPELTPPDWRVVSI